MKRFLALLLLTLTIILSNCNMQTEEELKDWYNLNSDYIPNELKNLNWNNDTDNSSIIVHNYVVAHFTYVEYANEFHSAEQTLEEKKGNCANLSLVELALVNYLSNGKVQGKLIYCYVIDPIQSGLHYTPEFNNDIMMKKYITAIYDIVDFNNIGNYIYFRQ